MQTDAADVPNSQQILQHWINKNQVNKNQIEFQIHFSGKSQYTSTF